METASGIQRIILLSNDVFFANALRRTLQQKPFCFGQILMVTPSGLLKTSFQNTVTNVLLINTMSIQATEELELLNQLNKTYFKKIILFDSNIQNAKSKITFTDKVFAIDLMRPIESILYELKRYLIKGKTKEQKSVDEICKSLATLNYLYSTFNFTDEETAMISLIKNNYSNEQIAHVLHKSLPGCKRLMARLADKMGVSHERVAILMHAISTGMIMLDEPDRDVREFTVPL